MHATRRGCRRHSMHDSRAALPSPNSPLPLAGIRVLEFCHTIMGPTAGLILADLGADVIKIEPVGGDHTRRLYGFAAGFFPTFNRNKRSLAVDLKSDEGRALLHRLGANRRRGPGKLRARHHGPARLRLCRSGAQKSAADLLRAQRISQRTLRASPGARRGGAVHGRPCLYDRTAGPAACAPALRWSTSWAACSP